MIRYLFLAAGIISLIIGLIGIILPLLPTTPFVLLSAWLFSKSSDRFHRWLLNHKYTVSVISNWEENKSMPRNAKVLAIAMVAFSMGCSVLFILKSPYLRVMLALLAVAIISLILRVPTTESFTVVRNDEG